MSGLSAPNGTDIDFAKFEDRFSLVDLRTLVPNLRTCMQRMFGRKNTEHTNVRGSLFTVLGLKCQEGARLSWPLPLSCPVFSSLFPLSLFFPPFILFYITLCLWNFFIFYFLLFIFFYFSL